MRAVAYVHRDVDPDEHCHRYADAYYAFHRHADGAREHTHANLYEHTYADTERDGRLHKQPRLRDQ